MRTSEALPHQTSTLTRQVHSLFVEQLNSGTFDVLIPFPTSNETTTWMEEHLPGYSSIGEDSVDIS